MTNLQDIKYADFQPKLSSIGEVVESVEDINQCIYIILATQKSSVPHRPDFGSDIHKYIDYPINEAVPNIIRETIEAINKWETRIEIEETTAEIDQEKIKISIEWKLKDSDITSTAEVSL